MRWSLLALFVFVAACAQSEAQQVTNNWRNQFLDHDSGCHAKAIVTYWDPDTEDWETLVDNQPGKDNYAVYAGHYATAEAELTSKDWCRAECYSSISIDDVDPQWHMLSVAVNREHASRTDQPLTDTTAVTFFDVWAVGQFEADKSGLAWGRMSFNKPLPDPMEQTGPIPQICDGMAIRGNLHSSHVEYTWNAGLWRWERTGEIVHYDAQAGHNVTHELTAEMFPGLRGLTYQQFFWPFEVSANEWVESYADINGHGWEFANQIVSEQQGSFTISRDGWRAAVELRKEINDLP